MLTAVLVLAATVALVGCDEVENGSKITRMTMTLEYTDAEGTATTRNVELKLYHNYAPKTVENFINLAKQGFYNGVCISNVQSNWLEFGAYKYVNGAFTRVDGNVTAIDGEFSKNGWLGNPLLSSSGALIMKRDYSVDTNANQVYNSAKSTVILALGSVSKFNSSEYCIFGKVVNDDEAYTVSASEENTSATSKTSLDACKALTSLAETEDGVKTYYYENYGTTDAEGNKREGGVYSEFYCSKYDEDEGVTKYYKGATVNAENEITDENLETLKDMLTEESYAFLVLPYNTVTIKSITVKK